MFIHCTSQKSSTNVKTFLQFFGINHPDNFVHKDISYLALLIATVVVIVVLKVVVQQPLVSDSVVSVACIKAGGAYFE